jgi:hypothetical protein
VGLVWLSCTFKKSAQKGTFRKKVSKKVAKLLGTFLKSAAQKGTFRKKASNKVRQKVAGLFVKTKLV